jgi:hypothetical protein
MEGFGELVSVRLGQVGESTILRGLELYNAILAYSKLVYIFNDIPNIFSKGFFYKSWQNVT